MSEEEKVIKYLDKTLDNMKKELKEIEKENETNCIIAIEHLRYNIYHLEIIKYLIETQDKMIDYMADTFDGLDDGDTYFLAGLGSKKEIIEYFRKKVEEDE